MDLPVSTRRHILGTAASLRVLPITVPDTRADGTGGSISAAPRAGMTNGSSATELSINGQRRSLLVDPGTNQGCDLGSRGASTVHVDGTPVLPCLTLTMRRGVKQIITIEGLSEGDSRHPVEAAFLEHDALQYGYRTPGQIMSAISLIRQGDGHTDDEIPEWMGGNICQRGAYPNIVAAFREVAASGPTTPGAKD